MSTLAAVYKLPIEEGCLIQWPDDIPDIVELKIDGFEIEAALHKNDDFIIENIDGRQLFCIRAINVTIKRDEPSQPPEVVINENEKDYFVALRTYIDKRRPEFNAVATEVINRIIRFFRYKLRIYSLQEINKDHSTIQNPEWYDGNGRKIKPTFITASTIARHRLLGEADITPLSPNFYELFSNFINTESTKSTAEELLLDALSALHNNDLRRAILELAIATELMVKRTIFPKENLSGSAFDYLEDKSKIKVTVPELINCVCKKAFGSRINTEYEKTYEAIQCLFNCRNKVAHRGEIIYIDTKGNKKIADKTTASYWYDAVTKLKVWLESLSM